ncbi:MAG: DUF4242 domain-containing protein [Candidatus Dadabacteria bacterium]
MPRYVIEREIPGAGNLSHQDLVAISQKSCNVLDDLGPKIQWIESFVTEDKIYCVYQAPNKEIIKKHAEMGGFPANRIEEIKNIISPVTAEKFSTVASGESV